MPGRVGVIWVRRHSVLQGWAVQAELMNPMLEAPGPMLLKLRCDGPVSNFAFNLNLRRYSKCPKGMHSGDTRGGQCLLCPTGTYADIEAGGVLRTRTRPTLNLLLLHGSY
jgi:hypothetical protein